MKLRKGTKVMVKFGSRHFGEKFKAVYIKPAVRKGYHFIRYSTPSGGCMISVPRKAISKRPKNLPARMPWLT